MSINNPGGGSQRDPGGEVFPDDDFLQSLVRRPAADHGISPSATTRVKSMHKLQARSSNQKLPTRTCRVILPGLAAQDASLIDGSKAARISDEAAWAEAISHYEKANADTQWEACLDAFFADLLQLPAR